MTFRDIVNIDPKLLEFIRKIDLSKTLLMVSDYVDEQERRRENMYKELTKEEQAYLDLLDECTNLEDLDAQQLDEYEEELKHLVAEEETVVFEDENEKVFVKSLYTYL